jgi:hypothetical protein
MITMILMENNDNFDIYHDIPLVGESETGK